MEKIPSTRPELTYELRIEFPGEVHSALAVKGDVITWLTARGVDTFVEGVIDNIDVDFDDDHPNLELFHELGGDRSAISIFKFDRPWLELLHKDLLQTFAKKVQASLHSMATEVWTEGWKEAVQPVTTEKFFIYPPWHAEKMPEGKMGIVIEPGMAFGVGQHPTTHLCVRRLEDFWEQSPQKPKSLLDVGCGTGILAIVGAKLGFKRVVATDIDQDAIAAARANAKTNGTQFDLYTGSFPPAETFDYVVANILPHILVRLLPELKARMVPKSGRLLLSGITVEYQKSMEEAGRKEGLVVTDVGIMDGWTRIELGF